ncbi:MAG: glycosyltransferase family 4 protein [Candidatus Pseudobacter hemicellulosilyticus]|uniref:Glycosyltransferase family 4 protein n=1 Tax=Candidatus Pseudobacter hemicellulosilyticus TaxID=3121375 RepID=A0AAJ6BG35_9BACT|nr:MAG: glycosyltransferase family 4 protein [Pseudobacter sp.]
MERHLHIVCFDVPYPVNYGGLFDLYYKLIALHHAGVQIHLHCFEYGRGEQPELEKYCAEVKYYPRQCGHKGFSHKLPYIVASRANPELAERLLQDEHPILLEGIHCTYLLHDERFEGRKIILRLMNVEYQYYRELYNTSTAPFKKLYYLHESKLLRAYEASIAQKVMVLAISEQDVRTYREEFGAKNIAFLPVFLPFSAISSQEGVGCFCLYQGNLSVDENEKAAVWLMKEVFSELPVNFIVAGKDPSRKLERVAERYPRTCVVANPSEDEMQDMIAKAQVNILPSFNCTGVKLKLINALFNGRHCVVNDAAVKESSLAPACHIGTNADAFKSIVAQLYHSPFTQEEIVLRQRLLEDTFNNQQNARRLMQWIWG